MEKWCCIPNWAQYRLVMKYLEMEDDQTLVMYSRAPLGLFLLHDAPRVVVIMEWLFKLFSQDDYDRMNALELVNMGK